MEVPALPPPLDKLVAEGKDEKYNKKPPDVLVRALQGVVAEVITAKSVKEERPPTQAAPAVVLRPGGKIKGATDGTIGGFLFSQGKKKFYLFSDAHVLV